MSKIVELFGCGTGDNATNWQSIVSAQACPYSGKRCYKVRKSDSGIAIGTCTVHHGKSTPKPIIICPTRLTERRQIFLDCLHLLTSHEPGNEIHIVPEVSLPGGSVDFFVASVRAGKVVDFAGVELQTMDTTGTVWPERQRFLRSKGLAAHTDESVEDRGYGINWKMTAKTILVQMHHKIQTFEHLNKKMALVIQDVLLDYMTTDFDFGHLRNPASLGDSMHFHAYALEAHGTANKLRMVKRLSTDEAGIGRCLGLQAEARIELELIVKALEAKISPATRFAVA